MYDIEDYLESTYLKTSEESGIPEEENVHRIISLVNEAIRYNFKLVMIRAKYILLAKKLISKENSDLLIGTVIDFPLGKSSTEKKIQEARAALSMGADELDYVADYNRFKLHDFRKFDQDIILGTKLGEKDNKPIKWIIETGALNDLDIIAITERISMLITRDFPHFASSVFIKTSTGYYDGEGATIKDVKIISDHSGDLPVKASGGISNFDQFEKMVNAGATRIGTSKAINIFLKK